MAFGEASPDWRTCRIGHILPAMNPTDKPLVWLRGEVKTPPFSAAARLEAGTLLRRLQAGEKLHLPHSRPMPSIGRRCHELRIVDEGKTWRIVYRLDRDAVVIADVFQKTTQQTPRGTIDDCQRRLHQYDELTGEEG
jgi:phage-related protein